jgi:hypothetical protein
MITKFDDFIFELFSYGYDKNDIPNGSWIILYKENLWILNDDNFEEYSEEISKKLNIDDSFDDLYDMTQIIKDEKQDVFIGEYVDDTIKIYSFNYRHSQLSTDLKKLKKELGKNITVNYDYGMHLDKQSSFEIDDNVKFYHGTCLKFLDSISKKGLISTDITNFDNINHEGKVFITTNIEKALFHSVISAQNNNSIPIIIELKDVPDKDKLIEDFDVVLDFYNKNQDLLDKFDYDIDVSKLIRQPREDINRHNLSKKLGIFGYLGRIPASYIESVHMDSMLFDELKWKDEYGESITDEDLDNIEPVELWNEFNIKDLQQYIQDAYDEMMEEDY